MKLVITLLSIVLLGFSTAAWCGDPCQKERDDWDRALKRVRAALEALRNYESSPVAPLAPGQYEKELQQYKDNYEAAVADANRTDEAYSQCQKRKSCKKWKGGWFFGSGDEEFSQ